MVFKMLVSNVEKHIDIRQSSSHHEHKSACPDMTSKKQGLKDVVKKPDNGICPEIPKVNCLKNPRIIDDASKVSSGVENNFHEFKACPLSKQAPKVDGGFKKSSEVNSTLGLKRRSEEVIKGPVSKKLKLKLDRSTTLLCDAVLEKLMSNPLSNLFKVPVDPVLWNIGDYFDIIKHPMDLGTIKRKLLQHKYDRAEEFEADVRLTFSNAMLYNPPDHYIHQRASSLIRVFDRLWEHRDVRQRSSDVHKNACPLSSSKFKCDVATEKMIPYDEFTAVKDKHTSTSSFTDLERGYASAPTTSGSFGATTPSTSDSVGATAKGLETISDVELSPSRALHIAKLKSRYAETIMKAQNHTLLEPGAEVDKTKPQQEKKVITQRRQHEETDNMGSKIRAAKLAARSREESELKRQRQEAREAARMALIKMEQSVNVEDNFQVMRDFEALIGISHQSLS